MANLHLEKLEKAGKIPPKLYFKASSESYGRNEG